MSGGDFYPRFYELENRIAKLEAMLTKGDETMATTIHEIVRREEYVMGLRRVLAGEIERFGDWDREARKLLPSLRRCSEALARDAKVGFDSEGERTSLPLLTDSKGPWDFVEPEDG